MAKKLKTIVGLDGGNNSIKLVLADSVAVNYENIYCELNEESLEMIGREIRIEKLISIT